MTDNNALSRIKSYQPAPKITEQIINFQEKFKDYSEIELSM